MWEEAFEGVQWLENGIENSIDLSQESTSLTVEVFYVHIFCQLSTALLPPL